MSELMELVYDTDLKRPACVLLQAVFGCGASPEALHFFEPQDWLTHPTPGMKKLSGDESLWRQVAEITVKARQS